MISKVSLTLVSISSFCLAACSVNVQPSAIRAIGMASQMPRYMNDSYASFSGHWKVIQFEVERDVVLKILRITATFRFDVTDCNGNLLSGSNPVFYEEIDIDGTYTRKSDEISRRLQGASDKVNVRSYVPTAVYSNRRQLCGMFGGGSMAGVAVV